MKVTLYGKDSKNIEPLVQSLGFQIVDSNPDVVISKAFNDLVVVSYGGDGTLLSCERGYPGIPKLPMRNSEFCNKCPDHKEEVLLEKLKKGKLELKEYSKLETEIDPSTSSGQGVKTLLALNDFVIRNKEPMHSIRFTLTTGHPELDSGSILIGDGIVVSTPFGSTGYFKSITQQSFDSGFGLAFNNTTEKVDPIFLGENDQMSFKLVRGQAGLTSDNNPDIYPIQEGLEIKFKLSDQKAKIYEADSLRCPNCQVIRG